VVKLSDIMLNVTVISVIMPNVVAPFVSLSLDTQAQSLKNLYLVKVFIYLFFSKVSRSILKGLAPSLACKYKARVKVLKSDKHSRLQVEIVHR
jgi:hypothetical protein